MPENNETITELSAITLDDAAGLYKAITEPTPPHPTCRTCPYADDIDDPIGACRAEPPFIVELDNGEGEVRYGSVWPPINADHDWCGKHPAMATAKESYS